MKIIVAFNPTNVAKKLHFFYPVIDLTGIIVRHFYHFESAAHHE